MLYLVSYDILYQGYMSWCHMMLDLRQNLHIDLEVWTSKLLNMEDIAWKTTNSQLKVMSSEKMVVHMIYCSNTLWAKKAQYGNIHAQ